VESEVGQGTEFSVLLPASEGVPASEESSELPSGGSGRVLLVEDEEGVRRLIATILEQNGYSVLTACDGEEALTVFAQCGQQVDLLISDVVMARMRGPELAIQLRKQKPGINVLFISGYTDPSITNQLALEESFFLQKPFAADALMRAVSEALRPR
jgi:two-component system, cell cycle sensor histidine kinase and response regulator CckA